MRAIETVHRRQVRLGRLPEAIPSRQKALRDRPHAAPEGSEVHVPHLCVDPIPSDVAAGRQGRNAKPELAEAIVDGVHETPRVSAAPNRRMGTDPGQAADLLDAGREPDGEPQGDDLSEDASPFLGIEGKVAEVSAITGPHSADLRCVPCRPEDEQAEPECFEPIDLVVRPDVHETTPRGEGDLNPRAQSAPGYQPVALPG